MRKILSLIISAALITPVFAQPLSASASCMASTSLIGTIASVTNQDGYSKINLDHQGRYEAGALSTSLANIDAYVNIAKAYAQNGYQMPQNMRPQDSDSPPPGYSSWDVYYSQNYTLISVSTNALANASYQVGDIILVGPPGGGACSQYGFTGIFSNDGTIKAVIASDPGLFSYTYGSETLSLSRAADFNCGQPGGWGTKCDTGITYSVNGQSVTLNGGDSRQLSGSKFSKIFLIESSHTILQDGQWVEDFSPYALTHVLTFATYTPAPPPPPPSNSGTFLAAPTGGQAPLSVMFTASGLSFTSIDYGDGSGERAPLFNVCAYGAPGCNVWTPTHVYKNAGTYTARLMNGSQTTRAITITVTGGSVAPPPSPSSSNCPIILRIIGRNSRGNDVTALQNYFISIGVLGASSATGFFGPLTEGAVQEWQASHGLISYGSPSTTGWGVVGPRTRTLLARCGQ